MKDDPRYRNTNRLVEGTSFTTMTLPGVGNKGTKRRKPPQGDCKYRENKSNKKIYIFKNLNPKGDRQAQEETTQTKVWEDVAF